MIFRCVTDCETAYLTRVLCTRCGYTWYTADAKPMYTCPYCKATLVSDLSLDLYKDAYEGDGTYDPTEVNDG